MDARPVCKTFEQHPQRKLCKECKHPREEHPLDENTRQHIEEEIETLAEDCGAEESKPHDTYAWIPPGCPKDRIEEYFKNFLEEKVPKNKTEGETVRMQQILKQIPPSDVSSQLCRFVEHDFETDLKTHIKDIRKKALHFGSVQVWKEGMPMQCPNCLQIMETGDLVVVPAKVSSTVYHPNCFICCVCKEQLEDLIHCTEVSGKIYCVRHYSETLKKRCHVCDELIFASKFAQAGDTFYHKSHLLCFHCDHLLEDNKGFEQNGELYCAKCYEDIFSQECQKCGELIPMNSQHVTFEDKSWHYNCFSCESCGKVITKFEQHEGKFYCIKCYNEKFAPRCQKCNEVFEGTTKVVKYQNEIYHVNCFKCNDCDCIIGTGNFIPHSRHVYCKECHLKNFSVRCVKCKNVILDDKGVMFNKQPFHKECFTCSRCETEIAGKSFKKIDGDLYCINCYGEVFCKKCHKCEKPVYLVGEKDFLYSYEDYRWHSDCFVCSNCKKSLADTSFTIRENNLICQNCTSQENTVSAQKGRKEVEGKESEETKTRHVEDQDPRDVNTEKKDSTAIENNNTKDLQ